MQDRALNLFDAALFYDPPKQFRPTVRWWWPGLAVDPEELKKELGELDDCYFGGAEVQSFLIGTPGSGAPNWNIQAHRFAPNPFYFQMLEVIAAEAAKRGLTIDLTIGSSWPPGGTQVTKEDSLKTLMMGTQIIHGGRHLEMPTPLVQLNTFYAKQKLLKGITGDLLAGDFSAEFKAITTIAIKPKRKDPHLHFVRPKAIPLMIESCIDLTSAVNDQGQLIWDAPEGFWQIFTIYAGPSGIKPLSDAKSSPDATSLVLDMFDEGSIGRFLDGHLKAGESILGSYYGSTIRAVFTDSQEIGGEWFWTSSFFEEFQKRRGYDIRPYLPVCFVPNRDNQFTYVFFMNTKPCYDFPKGIGDRIRYDWELTLSDLFAEIYCAGVSRYCQQYGIQHKIQTYGIRVDLLKAYGSADIPETEQLFAGGLLDFLKIAGSAGVLYQKPIVSAESLVWAQRDYLTTPLKWKVAADRLFIAGINHMNYHGFPYFANWKPFPGHYPWSPPCFSSNLNRNNPFWEFFQIINRYVARAQYCMQTGKTISRVALFYNEFNYDYKMLKSEPMVRGYLPGFDTDPPGGPIIWYQKRVANTIDKTILAFQQLGDEIMNAGYHYTHLNEERLLQGRINGTVLEIGDVQFEVLIFPNVNRISLELAQKLGEITNAGIRVIFYGSLPTGQPGFLDYQTHDAQIQTILNRLKGQNLFLVSKKQKLGPFIESTLQIKPDLIVTPNKSAIHFIHKRVQNGEFYFLTSDDPQILKTEITFPLFSKNVFELNLWTGEIFREEITEENGIKISLTFAPYGSKLMLFSDEILSKQESPEIYKNFRLATNITPINLTDWHLSALQRLANGEMTNIECLLPQLKDWRLVKNLRYISGPGKYIAQVTLPENKTAPDLHWILQLGRVHDVAVVQVNDHEFPPLLVPPYELEITEYLQAGPNEIIITVTGTIRNLLVGYGKMGIKGYLHHRKRSLMSMGLIGPVSLMPFLKN